MDEAARRAGRIRSRSKGAFAVFSPPSRRRSPSTSASPARATSPTSPPPPPPPPLQEQQQQQQVHKWQDVELQVNRHYRGGGGRRAARNEASSSSPLRTPKTPSEAASPFAFAFSSQERLSPAASRSSPCRSQHHSRNHSRDSFLGITAGRSGDDGDDDGDDDGERVPPAQLEFEDLPEESAEPVYCDGEDHLVLSWSLDIPEGHELLASKSGAKNNDVMVDLGQATTEFYSPLQAMSAVIGDGPAASFEPGSEAQQQQQQKEKKSDAEADTSMQWKGEVAVGDEDEVEPFYSPLQARCAVVECWEVGASPSLDCNAKQNASSAVVGTKWLTAPTAFDKCPTPTSSSSTGTALTLSSSPGLLDDGTPLQPFEPAATESAPIHTAPPSLPSPPPPPEAVVGATSTSGLQGYVLPRRIQTAPVAASALRPLLATTTGAGVRRRVASMTASTRAVMKQVLQRQQLAIRQQQQQRRRQHQRQHQGQAQGDRLQEAGAATGLDVCAQAAIPTHGVFVNPPLCDEQVVDLLLLTPNPQLSYVVCRSDDVVGDSVECWRVTHFRRNTTAAAKADETKARGHAAPAAAAAAAATTTALEHHVLSCRSTGEGFVDGRLCSRDAMFDLQFALEEWISTEAAHLQHCAQPLFFLV